VSLADKSLTELLQDDVELTSKAVHQQEIDNINNTVPSMPVFRFFDPSIPAITQTDVSFTGLGAVLLQNDQPSLMSLVR